MSISAWLRNAIRRREAAASFSEFAALRASPTDLGSEAAGGDAFTLTWPGRARVAIASSVPLAAGDIILAGASLPVGAANQVLHGPFVNEGRIVTIVTDSGLAACVLTVYALDEWARPFAVATGTVT